MCSRWSSPGVREAAGAADAGPGQAGGAVRGDYRLVDFVLSNLVNGGYMRIAVLTQYKSHSLDRHVTTTWRLSPLLGNYVTPVPAQMRRGRTGSRGRRTRSSRASTWSTTSGPST